MQGPPDKLARFLERVGLSFAHTRHMKGAPRKMRPPASTPRGQFTVRLTRDELDGGWTAECVELPGCFSDGATEREALANIIDAMSEAIAVRFKAHAPKIDDDDEDLKGRELAIQF